MKLKYKIFLFKERRINKIAMCCYMLFLMLIPYSLKAQMQYLNISKDQTATVNQVFDLIKKQTNYHFIYKSDLFKDMPKVSLKKGQIGVKALLKQILPADQFEVRFTGTTIAINAMAEKEAKAVESIGEVVITGYQKIDKKRSVGAVQILKPKDFDKVASLNLVDRLRGIAPGVRVDEDGNITIRGLATFRADSEPLIVVDGFPYNGGIKDLNTSDIAQVTVLKDATATAIYGIKGANGVIVITTKGGNTHGKLNINYTSNLQVSAKLRIKNMHLMNSEQYVNMEWEYYKDGGLEESDYNNYKSEVGEIYAALEKGDLTDAQAEKQLDVLRGYNNARDIEKYFLQRRIIQRHNLSLQYGTDKNQFYASMTLDKNQSNYVGNKDENYSFNLKDRFKFNRWAVFSLQSYGNYRILERNHEDVLYTRPYVKFLDKKGNYVDEAYGSFDLAHQAFYEKKGLLDYSYNRLQEQRLSDNEIKGHQLVTNFNIEISPFKWAKWTSSVSYRTVGSKQEDFKRKESYAVRSFINKYTDKDYKRRIPYGNILEQYQSSGEDLSLRTQLSLHKTFGSFHANFDGGLERNVLKSQSEPKRYHFNYEPQRLTESPVDFLALSHGFVSYRTSETLNIGKQKKVEDRYLSSYMIGDLSYKDKYNLSGSWRLDKTNLFGQSSKYRDQPSWSIGALWHLSQEDFFKVNFIDRLSLKVSYGLAGNIDKSTSPYLIGNQGRDFGTDEPVLEVITPQNPSLSWEKSYTFNTEIDFSFWNRRLSGSLTYYEKNTKDALSSVSLDPTTGFDSGLLNNGQISNCGIEAHLSSNILDHAQFKYGIDLNFTYNHNKAVRVEKHPNTFQQLISLYPQYVEGQPLRYLYGFRSAGLDEAGEPQVYDRTGKKVSWKDIEDKLTIEDGVFLGSRTPIVYGSFTHRFQYRELTVEAFFTYNLGHKVSLGYLNPNFIGEKNFINDEGVAHLPKVRANVKHMYYTSIINSDANIARADILRLKSIRFMYNLTSLIHARAIKGLQIRAGVENITYWSNRSTRRYYDRLFFPLNTNYTLGINVQF